MQLLEASGNLNKMLESLQLGKDGWVTVCRARLDHQPGAAVPFATRVNSIWANPQELHHPVELEVTAPFTLAGTGRADIADCEMVVVQASNTPWCTLHAHGKCHF